MSFPGSLLPGVLALLVSGCATGLGPRAVRSERPDYNQQIVRSADAEILLNLVRLRYNDSPLFLELGGIVAQYNYDATLSAAGTAGSGAGSATIGSSLGYSEKPTITYTPLGGEEFATRMLAPIPLDSVMLFAQSGWSVERLLLVTVQRVNDLFNAPTASGPTPERRPDYEAFLDFAERFRRLQAVGLGGVNWEMRKHEANVPGQNPRFWLRSPADPHSPLAADVAAVRRYLALAPGREEFELTAFPFMRRPSEVGMRCRSLLGVLYFLSTAVEPPDADVEAGLVTVTRDDDGRPFDWSSVMGKLLRIRSQTSRPSNASVAVQYRDSWFYIGDDDQTSKITFSLVNILFSLQAASGKGKSPLLTLPVGK